MEVSRKWGSHFGGLYKRDPAILGPYEVPLIFGNSQASIGPLSFAAARDWHALALPRCAKNLAHNSLACTGDSLATFVFELRIACYVYAYVSIYIYIHA